MELIVTVAVIVGVATLAAVALRSKSQQSAARICFTISTLGWLVALTGVTYAELFISDKFIYNQHISYSDRIIFQLLSGVVGGFICLLGIVSSIGMLQLHGKSRLLLVAIILGLLYIAVPIFWLFYSYK